LYLKTTKGDFQMTTKIESLTEAQTAALADYRRIGIEIGLATGPDFDQALVRELTDNHREICDVAKATNFLVYDSPNAAIKAHPACTPTNALYGQHDISWLIYYQFYRAELNVTGLDKIKYLLELAKHVGWMWMSSDTTIVTRRPKELNMIPKPVGDETIKVLHNYNGPAVLYADGWAVYAMNGTRIPKEYHHLVDKKASEIDVKEVMAIKNTEIRTEFLKKIGIEKAFESLQKTKLDAQTFETGGTYELFQVVFGDRQRIYLRGECPSNSEPFFEAVHPDCRTVAEGLHFRNFGTVSKKFQAPLELT